MKIKHTWPLSWPPGKARARSQGKSRFGERRFPDCIEGLRTEVGFLGGSELMVSANVPLESRGNTTSFRQPVDKAVAVYFTYKKQGMCFACDQWPTVEENLWAVVKTIGALRGIERWGSGEMMEQAFNGFAALPAPEQPWQVLGLREGATRQEIDLAYRRLAMDAHPDRGGDAREMARLNAAREALKSPNP